MAWEIIAINIGIALLSAGVAYAMRDRTKPPPDEPPQFDPADQFPIVSESAPIPVVFGTRMISSPNVVHIGAFSANLEADYADGAGPVGNATVRLSEAVRYRVDLTFALCCGPVDGIVRVDVDKRLLIGVADPDRANDVAYPAESLAFDTSLVGATKQVSDVNFFGTTAPFGLFETGESDGIAGRVSVSPGGSSDTLVDGGGYGYPTHNLGHLRGVVTATLRGLEAGSSDDFLASGGAPFYHGTSSRLRPWRFLVERTMRRGFDDPQWYDTKARIEASTGSGSLFDMNPAHIAHEILTDRAWGLGLDDALIDDTAFRAAADLFHSEGAGMSILWNSDSEFHDILREVERVTNSSIFEEPSTGLWTIQAIRDDWTLEDLPQLDASNVLEIPSYVVPSTDDLPTTVRIVYWDLAEMRDRIYTVHDQAAIESRGREIIETVQYPGVVTRSHIRKLAHRDLRELTRPRALVELEVQPSAAEDLRRGDAFRLVWDDYGVDAVFRVAQIDWGTVADPVVKIEAVEDIFRTRSEWVDEPDDSDSPPATNDPQDTTPVVDEIPYFIWQREPFAPSPLNDWIGGPIDPGADYDSADRGEWRNRAIVWAPRPVDGDDAPLWDHAGFRVGEMVYDDGEGDVVGTLSITSAAKFAPRCEITADITRSDTESMNYVEGATYGDHAVPYTLEHDSPYWSPRVGDVIRVAASSPTTSPTITFDQAGPPARRYDYSHLDAGSHEFLIVVGVTDENTCQVLRGCFDTVVHETIAAQTALVVGWLPVTPYGLWDVANLGLPWFAVDVDGWQGYHGLGLTRDFDPAETSFGGDTVYVDARALTQTPAGLLDWDSATSNVIELTKPDSLPAATPATIHRALRPLVPGAIRVIDDEVALELRVECEARNRLADYVVPADLFASQLEGAPLEATRWEVDPETYAECWIFDGEVDPPEFLTILDYDATAGAFVWSNADEEAAYNAKNGTSQLFTDLWICVLTNDRSDVTVSKARPSYQFARFHLTREGEDLAGKTYLTDAGNTLNYETIAAEDPFDLFIAPQQEFPGIKDYAGTYADTAFCTASTLQASGERGLRMGHDRKTSNFGSDLGAITGELVVRFMLRALAVPGSTDVADYGGSGESADTNFVWNNNISSVGLAAFHESGSGTDHNVACRIPRIETDDELLFEVRRDAAGDYRLYANGLLLARQYALTNVVDNGDGSFTPSAAPSGGASATLCLDGLADSTDVDLIFLGVCADESGVSSASAFASGKREWSSDELNFLTRDDFATNAADPDAVVVLKPTGGAIVDQVGTISFWSSEAETSSLMFGSAEWSDSAGQNKWSGAAVQITGDLTINVGPVMAPSSWSVDYWVEHSGSGESEATNYLYRFGMDSATSLGYFAEGGSGVNISCNWTVDAWSENEIREYRLVREVSGGSHLLRAYERKFGETSWTQLTVSSTSGSGAGTTEATVSAATGGSSGELKINVGSPGYWREIDIYDAAKDP